MVAAAQPVNTAGSIAFGDSVDLSVASLINLSSGKTGLVSGLAPAPYSADAAAVPVGLDSGVPLVIDLASGSGAITTHVSSDVDGAAGTRTTTGNSHVADLDLSVAKLVLAQPLVQVKATAVNTEASVTGQTGSLVGTSKVSITGLTIKVLGTSISLPADLTNVPPNTGLNVSVAGAAGVTILLNETGTSGTAAGEIKTYSNAIRISLNAVNLGLVNVLNGDIIIGHAEAFQGSDSDHDGVADDVDADSDGDGIPNSVEIPRGDTDGDGVPNYLDLDSDNDGINDVIEAGGKDANGDGRQDASGDGNADEDHDGLVDSVDPDDNVAGGGKGHALAIPDSDGDGVPNYLDLDSDNDGISDLYESGQSPVNDASGVLPAADADHDGISDVADGFVGFGDAPGIHDPLPDTDGDGIPNSAETDSNNDGIPDIVGTMYAGLDGNGDGRIDSNTDTDGDGIPNVIDMIPTGFGGLPSPAGDLDGDGISNQNEGDSTVDIDGDGLPAFRDADTDGDGIPDSVEGMGDADGDGIPNFRDLDSDGDGINDVIEAGGLDANGDGRQDASGDGNPDEDHDGLVDSVDPDDVVAGGGHGVPLVIKDSDGDGVPNFLDLDSDNDTISDLIESGLPTLDANNDGISDGGDADGDGIANSADGLPNASGDANDHGPIDSDNDGIPNYLDPNSGVGVSDIVLAGHGNLDQNGDGRVDAAADGDGDGIPDAVDTDPTHPGGLAFNLLTYAQWASQNFTPSEQGVPAIAGPKSDADGDGYSNLEEFALNSNPKNPQSTPNLVTLSTTVAGVNTLQLTAVRNPQAYAFVSGQASRNLMTWSSSPDILTLSTGPSGQVQARINNSQGGDETLKGFLRLYIQLP